MKHYNLNNLLFQVYHKVDMIKINKCNTIISAIFLFQLIITAASDTSQCQPCYYPHLNQRCQQNGQPFLLHMSVHPHLDAFWIYDFQEYYQPNPNNLQANQYFRSNKFSAVKQTFDTALSVLAKSQKYRQLLGQKSQKAKRTFFNSQIGFFKHWFLHLNKRKQILVKQLLQSSYWQILGGGFVEHDEGCAYYEDIIQNFEIGLHFLKQNLDYVPKIAISADSFGHSQSTVAILAQMGIQGFFVQRSDQHILEQNKTQFIWRAKSTNNITYGVMPTHIRWAIHGFEDQFDQNSNNSPLCAQKQPYIEALRKQNRFLKKLLKSNHVMRYFGHDFQQFKQEQYDVIETIMQQFSKEKCENVAAVYTNPTQYFKILMGEVFNKTKAVVYRNQDIFPIWDYDSGLYWTGYYTTDPYHKKFFRDCGRYLHAVRKAFFIQYIEDPKANYTINSYEQLQSFAQTVAYLQHHDGISGTSKYAILDKYQIKANDHIKYINKNILNRIFQDYYPLYTNNPLLICGIFNQCIIPDHTYAHIFVKVFNSGTRIQTQPIIIRMPENQFYQTDCKHQIICMCVKLPCKCQIYVYPQVFTFTQMLLKKVQNPQNIHFLKQAKTKTAFFSYNQSHIILQNANGGVQVGYKQIISEQTKRQYEHLNRQGNKIKKTFNINSGKYAIGNNPNKISDLSRINKILYIQTAEIKKILIIWDRQGMKTVITSTKILKNSWKVQTYSSAKSGQLQDLYIQFGSKISNGEKFFTDSNGWLTMQRKLYTHEDYKAFFSKDGFDNIAGNTYPMTSFAYIQDILVRLTVNTDRPQGVISYKEGKIWANFDRLTNDDGKWVYQTTYRSQYQKFVHYVSLDNKIEGNPNSHRIIQQLYDQPIIVQLNDIQPTKRFQTLGKSKNQRNKWVNLSAIQDTKFWIRTWNDSSVTLRIQNIYDDKNITVGLFATKISPFLTTFYGNSINIIQIYQMALGGNMKYEEFLANKWNWNQVVDLTKENNIFNRKFSEKIELRPLQIRTFRIKGIGLRKCMRVDELTYSNRQIKYQINTTKNAPTRPSQNIENEKNLTQYLQNGDHCKMPSPVFNKQAQSQMNIKYDVVEQILKQPDSPISKNERRKAPQWQNTKTQQQQIQKQIYYKPQQKRQAKKQIMQDQKYKQPIQKIQDKKQISDNDSTNLDIPQCRIYKQNNELFKICKKINNLNVLNQQQKYTYFYNKKSKIQLLLKQGNKISPN